jgi:ABC-2 type transport system permease protein
MSIEVGEAIGRLLGAILFGAALTYLFAGGPPSAEALALAIPAVLLACTCNIVSQHAFGGIAFWLRDAKSTWFVYQKFVFLPGGMLLPLEMLPHWLAAPSRLLPFAAMAYVPGRIAAGHIDLPLMASQLFWLAVLLMAAVRVFGAGQRRLELVGG